MNKKLLAFIIIAASIITSILIINYNGNNHSNQTNGKIKILPSNNNVENNNSLLDFKITSPVLKSIYQSNTDNKQNQINNADNDNLTAEIVKTFTREIQKRNPGQISSSTLTLPSQSSFEQILAEKLEQGLKIPQLSLENIKISKDNSVAKKMFYLSELQKITEKNFGSFNKDIITVINDFVKKNNSALLKQYVAIASNQVKDLTLLEAPYDWRLLHLQIVNSWLKKKIIYDTKILLKKTRSYKIS